MVCVQSMSSMRMCQVKPLMVDDIGHWPPRIVRPGLLLGFLHVLIRGTHRVCAEYLEVIEITYLHSETNLEPFRFVFQL